jgi:hypothetical protein
MNDFTPGGPEYGKASHKQQEQLKYLGEEDTQILNGRELVTCHNQPLLNFDQVSGPFSYDSNYHTFKNYPDLQVILKTTPNE